MLSFIPTPIGNKEDITLRALRLLRELDVFFCEDTRTVKNLFRMYDIPYQDKKFYALTSHSDDRSLAFYVSCIEKTSCGVISEAWTPWLSDPWKILIKLARESWLPFEILPWANALIPAIVGTPCDTSIFTFGGFVPAKKWRKSFFERIMNNEHPVFVYESVHRVKKTFQELLAIGYTGKIVVHRELSKMFEQKIQGSAEEMLVLVEQEKLPLKWEFVLGFYSS